MNISDYLLLQAVKATEAGAIAAHELMGLGDEEEADRYAVEAMRAVLNTMPIKGKVVIGEGERDRAPMLYIGEEVGVADGPEIDIALDPLEGTTILANGGAGALSVIAFASKGNILHAPDVYMDKVALGFNHKTKLISVENSVKENLINVARAKKCDISDLNIVILKRRRHEELVARVRECGARVILIGDGDIAAVISTTMQNHPADIYMGIGGAPEGVLAAAVLAATGGQMSAKLIFDNEVERARAKKMGLSIPDKVLDLKDMVRGDVIFSATGVTDGPILSGIKYQGSDLLTNSLCTSSVKGSMHICHNKYYDILNS